MRDHLRRGSMRSFMCLRLASLNLARQAIWFFILMSRCISFEHLDCCRRVLVLINIKLPESTIWVFNCYFCLLSNISIGLSISILCRSHKWGSMLLIKTTLINKLFIYLTLLSVLWGELLAILCHVWVLAIIWIYSQWRYMALFVVPHIIKSPHWRGKVTSWRSQRDLGVVPLLQGRHLFWFDLLLYLNVLCLPNFKVKLVGFMPYVLMHSWKYL